MDKYLNNPVVERTDIPAIAPDLVDVSSVFNPGATFYNGKIMLMLRVQNRARETYFVMAESDDGIKFSVEENYITWKEIDKIEEKIFHIYDPRITRIGKVYYILFAMDLESGCKLGLGRTTDFKDFYFLATVSREDNRNGVLFPEKIDGKFLRLDRPNLVQLEDGPLTGSSIWLSESRDLIEWKPVKEIIKGKPHYWDELIGAGPPPVKTYKGWLQIYHGIAMHYQPIYQAGVLLLDLADPSKLIARGRFNILEPRELYETTGQVPNVCFPTGIIVDEYDENGYARPESRVSIYYGAADTSVGLATSTIADLLDKCFE